MGTIWREREQKHTLLLGKNEQSACGRACVYVGVCVCVCGEEGVMEEVCKDTIMEIYKLSPEL